jgi:hypothetical protein
LIMLTILYALTKARERLRSLRTDGAGPLHGMCHGPDPLFSICSY